MSKSGRRVKSKELSLHFQFVDDCHNHCARVLIRCGGVYVTVTEMALTLTSLKGALAHHEVKTEDLDFKCPQEVRDRIAEEIIDEWNLIGRALKVSRSKLNAIHSDIRHSRHEDKAVDMLNVWAEEHGERATCLKLAEALNRRTLKKRKAYIEILCHEVKRIRPGLHNSGNHIAYSQKTITLI